jgi:phosphopantothenoylcysteine decarboxylase/phosphopantothenate--cysteine ligase
MTSKKILLAVTGSIAAYKAAHLTRLLVKAGAEVQVLMTPSATEFIAPLTLSTLSKRPVYTDIIASDSWNSHVDLGLWADAMLVAPATANTLARMATGICDNIVAATYLSAKCPVILAPAMDLDMWRHPATQSNLDTLRAYGHRIIPVGYGELASGLVGEGRMAEPEQIMEYLEVFFRQSLDLQGVNALVTAGPTYEPLDPVRFIGNHSSGKMGIAIAEALAGRGARVRLILGPSRLSAKNPGIETTRVQTAEEMLDASVRYFHESEITILAAAVADYRPAQVATEKIKKTGDTLHLELVKTPDIAATLGQAKRAGQLLAGFALETTQPLEHAREKLHRKNFDFIVLNSLRDPGAGFEVDTNKISILFPDNTTQHFELKSKPDAAADIVAAAMRLYESKKRNS